MGYRGAFVVIVIAVLSLASHPGADARPTPPPTPAPTASPSPTPVPSPSIDPSPSPTTDPAPSTSPSPGPSASPAPSPEPSASPAPSPEPSASPTSAPDPSPSPDASASSSPPPSPTPAPSSAPLATTAATSRPPEEYLVNVERLIAASSLSAFIEARSRLAGLELETLEGRYAELAHQFARVSAELVIAMEEHAERAPVLQRREARLARNEGELARLVEAVDAKRTELARLAERARLLAAAADPAAGDVAVLRALADDARATAEVVEGLAATAGDAGGETRTAWRWPLAGTVTQTFGPTALALEPPARYGDVAFAHFHDAIDIAAPLGTPVVAAADGLVTFVGHVPDGALIVLIAHDDGLVSLSAHLDDTFAPPPVRTGDRVQAGDVVGYVGMTGITTGPHLHFSVRSPSGPIDPLVVLTSRS